LGLTRVHPCKSAVSFVFQSPDYSISSFIRVGP
jgi:hypothetical protein